MLSNQNGGSGTGPIYEGQALSASTLSGGVGSVEGTFAFTAPESIPAVGTSSQSVIFTPSSGNFTPVSLSVSVTVIDMSPNLLSIDISGGGITVTFDVIGDLDETIVLDLETATSLESPDWTSAANQSLTVNEDGTATLSADLPEGEFGVVRIRTSLND